MPEDVARELGFASTTVVPDEVAVAWPVWQELHPQLRMVEAGRLREWLRQAPAGESDPVLLVLARRASLEGERDHVAAKALVWCLLPGAHLVARRYHHVERIDFIVAEQLWMQACEFPWQTKTKVAANVLRDVRYNVLRELGVSNKPDPEERLYSSALRFVDTVQWAAPSQPTAAEELHELLDLAVEEWVISRFERHLLLEAVNVAYELEHTIKSTGVLGGLVAPRICAKVAERFGMSVRTTRRRITDAITALREWIAPRIGEVRDVA